MHTVHTWPHYAHRAFWTQSKVTPNRINKTEAHRAEKEQTAGDVGKLSTSVIRKAKATMTCSLASPEQPS